MSSADCGKTFRRIIDHIPQNSLLQINSNALGEKSIELLDFKYSADVCYSMKKRSRWMLSTMLCDEEYDHEKPFIYTKQQCIWDRNPITTNYLYDSLTKRKFGSHDISDRKLHGKSFNSCSVIRSLEDEFNYSKREIDQFNNLKSRKKKKSKKSRKNHRGISTYIPGEDDELPPKDEYLQNIERRKDCIHIKEFIHVNDLSRVNIIQPTKKTNFQTKKWTVRKRHISDDICEESDFDWDDSNESNEDIDVVIDEISESQTLNSTDSFDWRENILPKKSKLKKKKFKTHKKVPCYPLLPYSKEEIDHISINEEKSDHPLIILNRVVLPYITVDISYTKLIDDLNAIAGICRCWVSDTSPRFILADLQNIIDTKNKSFIILKLKSLSNSELFSAKILFNYDECDLPELLGRKYVDVRELVESLQTPLQSYGRTKSVSSEHFLELASPIKNCNGVWHTVKIDNQSDIYLEHQEWKRYEIDRNTIEEIVRDACESQAFEMRNCEICLTETAEDEAIMINTCKHIICETCLSSHLIYRVEMGMEILNCPGSGCSVELDCATTLSLLSWKQYEKRSNHLRNSVIRKTGITCYNCGAVLIWKGRGGDDDAVRKEYMCRCHERLCILCGKRQHWPSSCLEMRKHNQKLRKLKDLESFSQKICTLIVKGIECPKCSYFVEKEGGCNHLTCICGCHFCWICGIEADRHNLSNFPCVKNSYAKRLRFDLTNFIPDLSTIRPKLYILSLKQRISGLKINTKHLFLKIHELFDPKLDIDYGKFDARAIENQFIQLICITESSLVKAYQLNKGKKLNLYNYLKSSVSVLMFYQNLVRRCIEDTYYSMKRHRRGANTITQIKSDYSKLWRTLSDAQGYINQMHIVLRV